MNTTTKPTKKILIVEDDADTRRALNIRLRSHEYETAFAGDAISAVTVARNEAPDLILLDLGLPGGDGFLLMERFETLPELSSVPVVVLTGRDEHPNKRRAEALGAKAFFQKPADNEQLLSRISTILENDEA